MSKETLDWLNRNTIIGFTDKRGKAWHYREGTDNHFPGAVPIEQVRGRLFAWTAEEVPEQWTFNGKTYTSDTDKVIVRSDTGAKLGTFKNGYVPHQYGEWLLDNVGHILDDELSIGSAGLLKGGAVAWVSVEVPENLTTPEGVIFRPNLLACTSFDGSIATTYKRVVTNVVCDNTMRVALSEGGGGMHKVRHSRNSIGKLTEAREALDIVYSIGDEFEREVRELCDMACTDRQFEEIVDRLIPMPEIKEDKRPTAVTRAENQRDKVWNLWTKDERVAPWNGSAFGAWQAFNTYQHHENVTRGTMRQERNMFNAVIGKSEQKDNETLSTVRAVLA